MKQKITPCLWFNNNCEEAMNFYTSIIKDSKIISIKRYPDIPMEGPPKGFAGKVLTGIFELAGQRFMALDGGPLFKFTPATSFQIECDTQEEVDELWEKMSANPEAEQCGWIQDKFGLSWQIMPTVLGELLSDPDEDKANRVLQAMLQMKKIDIAGLQKAADQS